MQVFHIEGGTKEIFTKEADAPFCPDTAFVLYADHARVVYDCNKNLERVQNQRHADQREAYTLREVLSLLAPDLKAMAILYAQRGDHARSQALNNIAKSVGL